MDDQTGDQGKPEAQVPGSSWWPSDFDEKFQSLSIARQERISETAYPGYSAGQAETSIHASQTLWLTGTLSSPIPNGFYSVIPSKKLKDLFDSIPSPDDIHSLGIEGLKAEIILVDSEKDKKLFMLKQLCQPLVKGFSSNPAALIKKLANLVSDFYKCPNPLLSPARITAEEISHLMENRGIQLLGQIRQGSCRPRAILFKVLADSVGLESKLVVGLPMEDSVDYTDSCKHMSVIVELNSVEYLVDLMRIPGQLVPLSSKALLTSHFSAAGESDSADYDSCDSPLEPNSPMRGQRQEQDESNKSLLGQRADGSNIANILLRPGNDYRLSASHSEPNIANVFWGRSRRKAVGENERTTSISPEHPLSRTRARSMLGGERQSAKKHADSVAISRSDGASTSTSTSRRLRRRSMSITPEIGDDIVRAVRAMAESMKQKRLLKDCNGENSVTHSMNDEVAEHDQGHDLIHVDDVLRVQASSQKAVSLPSSPHRSRQLNEQTSQISDATDFLSTQDLMSTWNRVLQSSQFSNKPLLPFEEWHIDFSELTVGTRVGIGFFGEVFRGIWNGTDVAIKVFLEQDLTTENMEDFCNEVSILSRLRHPNVILFLGACVKPPHLSLVTEYMEMGSLYYLIHTSGQKAKLSWRRRLKMLRDICRGLMCMHRMKIVHRDLKSANCLVDKHWAVKICDFGLSKVMTNSPMKDSSAAGTPEWMAPELIRNEPYSEKCDIFSLGVIMWELCTLSRPWHGVPSVQVVFSVGNEGARLDIPDGPLGSLISDCWQEPEKRPNCQEILTRLLDCEYTLC